MALIARKDLFKQDPTIACYHVKQVFEGFYKLKEPTIEQQSQWHGVSTQQGKEKPYRSGSLENELYFWHQRNKEKLAPLYA